MSPYRVTYKKVRHYHEPGHLHELTFSCYRRLPLLTNDVWRKFLAQSIDLALEKHRLNLSAYVFMPEHIHLLIWPQEPAMADVAGFLKTLKLSSSTKIKNRLKKEGGKLLERLSVTERPGKQVFRFWQEGPGFDRNVTSVKQTEHVIDYLHANPLRRNLCGSPEDWLWSSYRHFLNEEDYPPLSSPRWTPLPSQYLQGD